MVLTIEFEDYYIPIELDNTCKERDDVKHFTYVCSECKGKIMNTKFCPICNKNVRGIKEYPDGLPDEVGGKDMWDYKRVPLDNLDIGRISMWKYIRTANKVEKKPKARDVARAREQGNTVATHSKGLKDLFMELGMNKEALACRVVFQGRINDAWIIPYPFFRKHKCLILALANGNYETIQPKESYDFNQIPIATRTDDRPLTWNEDD